MSILSKINNVRSGLSWRICGVILISVAAAMIGQARFEGRFDRMDERFDRIDEHFDRIDERFDRVDDRFDRVEEDLSQPRGDGQSDPCIMTQTVYNN